MYKGKLVHTITKQDVEHTYTALMEHIHQPDHSGFDYALMLQAMGRCLPCDIGKQVYDVNGIYQVESDEQMKARLS